MGQVSAINQGHLDLSGSFLHGCLGFARRSRPFSIDKCPVMIRVAFTHPHRNRQFQQAAMADVAGSGAPHEQRLCPLLGEHDFQSEENPETWLATQWTNNQNTIAAGHAVDTNAEATRSMGVPAYTRKQYVASPQPPVAVPRHRGIVPVRCSPIALSEIGGVDNALRTYGRVNVAPNDFSYTGQALPVQPINSKQAFNDEARINVPEIQTS